MHSKKSLLFVLFTLIITGCKPQPELVFIRTADSLLWTAPDSCVTYIQQNQSKVQYGPHSKRMELINQHAYYKITGEIENDSALNELADYFTQKKLYREAGEANYIKGAYYVQQGDFQEATSFLKTAERLYLSTKDVKPVLMGMLYLNLGIASEQCRLFDVALDYCTTAIPYLKESHKPVYLAVCYHLLGKSHPSPDTCIMYLDSALAYAKQINAMVYQKEIEVTRYNTISKENNETALYSTFQYLCDSCQAHSYAAELASYHIRRADEKKAAEYIQILALDTSINVWSREQYALLNADLTFLKGDKTKAYNMLKELHFKQTKDIEESAYASTYIISQKYDAAQEQELRLKETMRKQKAYIVVIMSLLLCVIIAAYAYHIYSKGKYKLQISNEQKKRIQSELEVHRMVLKTRIRERITVAREIYQWASHHQETLPNSLTTLSPKQASKDQENWKRLYDDFNLCYHNMLTRLQNSYPQLIDSDLQYIALTYLGFSITDISFLLGVSNKTIWNRKNTIKHHLGMVDEEDLDAWIRELQ